MLGQSCAVIQAYFPYLTDSASASWRAFFLLSIMDEPDAGRLPFMLEDPDPFA